MQAIQLVKVYNKSGKVISNKKHFVSLYDEAKAAYLERKTELKAARAEKQAKKSKSSSSRTPSPPKLPRRPSWSTQAGDDFYQPHEAGRPNMERGYTDTFYDDPRFAQQQSHVHAQHNMAELNRPHTSHDFETMAATHPELYDPHSDYAGELPPPLPNRPNPSVPDELRMKMTALQRLLMEANCVGTSAVSVVKTLKNDPDKMAAVALALAEISNLLRKLAPGALLSLKGSFPAIVALLLSSEFLIAAGVGVGVTVVAFGGYMVVKKIQAKQKERKEKKAGEASLLTPNQELSEVEEGDEREVDIESIRQWRRGVTEEDARSLGTSVDGEYVTDAAAEILARQQQQQHEWESMPQMGRRTTQPLQEQHVPQTHDSHAQQALLTEGTKEKLPWETVIQRAKSPAMAVKAFLKRDK
jgi:hypothetical protein